jgi:hypothetical protein
MSNTNICWDCRHGILKLKILVPLKNSAKERAIKTSNYQTDVVAINKEKPGIYNVWYRSNGALRLLSFKMFHVCKLKRGQEKNGSLGACRYYEKTRQPTPASIVYSKNVDLQENDE